MRSVPGEWILEILQEILAIVSVIKLDGVPMYKHCPQSQKTGDICDRRPHNDSEEAKLNYFKVELMKIGLQVGGFGGALHSAHCRQN